MGEKNIVTINEYIKNLVKKYPGLDITTTRDIKTRWIRVQVIYDLKERHYESEGYVAYDCAAQNFKSTITGLVNLAILAIENGGE